MSLWMLYSVLAATMVAGAALALEEGARLLGRPQRWGWLVAMAAAVALPVAARLLPTESPAAGGGESIDPQLLASLLARAPVVEESVGWADRLLLGAAADAVFSAAWAMAAAGMVAVLLGTYSRLSRLRRRGKVVEIAGVSALLTESTGPMVIGVRRPDVILPRWIETLPADEQRLVVRHEREHARAGDPSLLLLAAVLVAAMPWNLPLWWMRRRMRQAIEVDCDARVISAGADPRPYGAMLIRIAGRPRPTPLFAPALVELPSLLERRIIAMTAKAPTHRAARLSTAAVLAALLVAAACELSPRGSSPSPTEPTLAGVLDSEGLEIEDAAGDSATAARLYAETIILRRQGEDQAEVLMNGHTLRADTIRLRLRSDALDTGSADPLVFVDGEPVSDISAVDPERILRIEVLKDEAATDRFGAEGADGVVLVTTGQAGERRTRDPRPVVPATGAREGSARAPAAPTVAEEIVPVRYGEDWRPRSPAPAGSEAAAPSAVRARAAAPGTLKVAPDALQAAGDGTSPRTSEAPSAAAAAPRRRRAVAVRAEDFAITPGATAVAIEGDVRAVGYGVGGRLQEATAGERLPLPRQSAEAPLIIVDGKRFTVMTEALEGVTPDEIASIEVIKDAEAAVARYGARAAHGVVVITLKP